MQTDWAAQNLQIIRTLMERSAVYRRALAPLMITLGVTGLAAAAAAVFLRFSAPRAFAAYWMAVSVVGLLEAFFLIRRQSIKASEPYWSPPMRRVSQAILPALFVGFMAGFPFLIFAPDRLPALLLAPAWIVLYGCALHSAGFFMPRGVKLFGWGFILGGCASGLIGLSLDTPQPIVFCNWLMGLWFGGAHLAYGVYLVFTEKARAAA